MIRLFAGALLLWSVADIGAQGTPLPHPDKLKKERFIFRLPMPPVSIKKHDGVWVDELGDSYSFEGIPSDSLIGFPSAVVCERWTTWKRKSQDKLELIVRCNKEMRSVFFPLDSAKAVRAFNYVFANAADSNAIWRAATERVAQMAFTGKLAAVPTPTRERLVLLAVTTDVRPRFKTVDLQGKSYFAIDVGETGSAYNSTLVNQNSRIASALSSHLLRYIKLFGAAVDGAIALDGIVFQERVSYYRPLTNYVGGYPSDQLEIFVPLDAIRRFASAEITGQDLVDASIVLVDGNRTKLLLTDAR